MEFLFNFTFTRPDENNANVYHVGMNIQADDRATAEQALRRRNDHLTILDVQLFAVMNDDGDIVNA
jgi:hypothetical protein